ncbi:MAG: hypothetical protein WA446_20810 [Steroidobacteraceae bacterium]
MAIFGLHYLDAALKLVVDPTRNILQAFWSQAPTVMKPSVDWERVAESLLWTTAHHDVHPHSMSPVCFGGHFTVPYEQNPQQSRRLRLQQYAAAFALVEILARVHGHEFDLRMRTGRTRAH